MRHLLIRYCKPRCVLTCAAQFGLGCLAGGAMGVFPLRFAPTPIGDDFLASVSAGGCCMRNYREKPNLDACKITGHIPYNVLQAAAFFMALVGEVFEA